MSHVKDILNEVKRCCVEDLSIDTLPNYGILYDKQNYVRLEAIYKLDDPASVNHINVICEGVLLYKFKHDRVYCTRDRGEFTTTYEGIIQNLAESIAIESTIEVTTCYENVLERPVTCGQHTGTLTSVCYCLLAYMQSLSPKQGDPVQTFISKWLHEHQRDIWIGMCLPVRSKEEFENGYLQHCIESDLFD